MEARVALTDSANVYLECALKSYSAIVLLLLKCHVPDGNITRLDAEVRNLRPGSMITAEYAQDLMKRTLSCGSIYEEISLNDLFVGGVNHPILKASLTSMDWA